jgi:hypothetical protein
MSQRLGDLSRSRQALALVALRRSRVALDE